MEMPIPRVRLRMDCLEETWESLEGNRRCLFRGTVRFEMTSLVHPHIPARVIEACIEWEQPTPTQYERVAPVPVVEILSDSDSDEYESEEESTDGTAPVPSSGEFGEEGPVQGGQQPWLMASGSESSHQFHLEWMADRYAPWLAARTAPTPPVDHLPSPVSSVERSVAPESSGSCSGAAVVEVHSDSSSEEDPSYPSSYVSGDSD